MQRKTKNSPVLGKFILDSISIGMYNHPLTLYREYIQNSTDAIDEVIKNNILGSKCCNIDITINGSERKITIKDNGSGVPAEFAQSILHDIGKSIKKISSHRGFRGIGRLGGLGYCDELIFITKASNEDVVSTSRWNCIKLRKLISEHEKTLDANAVIRKSVKFSQEKYTKDLGDHFFIVEMINVKSARDQLLNVPLIKAYISQVAPVPFDASKFSHANDIDSFLRQRVPSYEVYNISVNGERVLKPYSKVVGLSKSTSDNIKNISYIDLKYENEILGCGWIADLELLGCINSNNGIDGLRVRTGNILVGDQGLLAKYFKETRFNNYLVGEIHTVNKKLLLNSRRDDFEDNDIKNLFYNCFVKEIGLPYSQKIRQKSEGRSKVFAEARYENLVSTASRINRLGHMSKIQQRKIVAELKHVVQHSGDDNLCSVSSLIEKVKGSSHFLDRNYTNIPQRVKQMIEKIFDVVYKECTDKKEAEIIITNIVRHVDKTFK